MPHRSSKSAKLEEARAAIGAAEEARKAGRHVDGKELATRAAALAAEANQPRVRASALALLCIHEWRLGDTESAIRHGLEALPQLKRSRDAHERSHVLCCLVMACGEVGMHTEAVVHADKAMESARSSGDPSLMSWALNRAGVSHENLGDHAAGERFMLQALDAARQISGAEEAFSALNNLCSNCLTAVTNAAVPDPRAWLERALRYGEEALQLAEASGNPHRISTCLGNLGRVYGLLGRHEDGLRLIERKERLAMAEGYRQMLLSAMTDRAVLEQRCGDKRLAAALYKRALADAHAVDDHQMLPTMHQGLYECFKDMGDFRAALQHHEEVLRLERREMQQRLDTHARLLQHRMALEQAQAEAERARLDAEVERLRAVQLESENRLLAVKAQELGRHALEDQLTGLANRRRVDHELPLQLRQAHERQASLSVAAVDLDHFKQVNDRFGHAVGDDVLRGVAQILLQNTRSGDLLARMGGEEFLVVFVGTPLPMASDICERLRVAVQGRDWSEIAPDLRVTISIGLCDAMSTSGVRELLERADNSLYAAKRAGRNRVQVAPA